MVRQILFCWIGSTDLKAAAGEPGIGAGPVAQAMVQRPYAEIALLNNWDATVIGNYIEWLQKQTSSPISLHNIQLSFQ